MNKVFLTIGKEISRTGLLFMIALVIFDTGVFYGRYSNGESITDFFLKEKIVEGEARIIYKYETNFYNMIVKLIWVALGFLFMLFTFDYFLDPENHFITLIKKQRDKYQKEMREKIG